MNIIFKITNTFVSLRGRRSRSESDSPPYLRQPVSLPPISRPKTNSGERETRLLGLDRPKTMGATGKATDFQVTVSGLALRYNTYRYR